MCVWCVCVVFVCGGDVCVWLCVCGVLLVCVRVVWYVCVECAYCVCVVCVCRCVWCV